MVSIGERNKSRSLSYPFENNRATIIISNEIEKEKKRERERNAWYLPVHHSIHSSRNRENFYPAMNFEVKYDRRLPPPPSSLSTNKIHA